MTTRLRIREMRIFRLAIPMRFRFEHAAASRAVSDPVVVQLVAEPPFGEFAGFGETLARPYVTGETAETVVADLRDDLAPRLLELRAESFAECLELIEALPFERDGRIIHAARAALELALIDLAGRAFGRRAAEVSGWLGLPGFGPPGALQTARYSGIVIGKSKSKRLTLLCAQRCLGLRDFKLKVAVAGWEERLAHAYAVLRRGLEAGRATLRVDANAGWTLPEVAAAIPLLERYGVSAIEQPLAPRDDARLTELASQTKADLIADESLVTMEDARRLLDGGGVQVFDIRLAKNGGLMPSLRMARMALAAGRDVQLGCMVGETSVLTAAGIAFIESCPQVRFVEGAYTPFLLKSDVARPSLRLGRGGRIRGLAEPGLGVAVDPARLERLSLLPAEVLRF